MRILLATYWYLPHVGGVDAYIRILQQRLSRLGHQVDVLAHHPHMTKIYMPNTGETLSKYKIKDVVYEKVYDYYERHLPHVDPWIRWREIERYVYELAAASFQLDRYDLIHTQDIISTRAIHRVKPPQVSHVATIHGLLANEHIIAGDIESKASLRWRYVSAEERYGATSADTTILPARWLLRELNAEFGVTADSVRIVAYGMEIEQFLAKARKAPEGLEIRPDRKYILCPARLVPVKGHQYLSVLTHELLGCGFQGRESGPVK
ncbi:MAG: glycosyltransferase family 4 protein [Alicyclobacillus sp.]|nr:glycosyltransferase family 4 protein [Alicyclobacillus sp.]